MKNEHNVGGKSKTEEKEIGLRIKINVHGRRGDRDAGRL